MNGPMAPPAAAASAGVMTAVAPPAPSTRTKDFPSFPDSTAGPSVPPAPFPDGSPPPDQWSFAGRGAGLRASWPKAAGAVLVILALLAGGLALASVRSGDRGHRLALSFMKGRQYRFHVRAKLNGKVSVGQASAPIQETLLAVVSWRVVDIDPHGVATIRASIDPVSKRLGGKPAPAGKPLHERLRLRADGRVLALGESAVQRIGGAGTVFVGLDQLAPVLPTGQVNPGDMWKDSFDQDVPYADKPLHLNVTSTLVQYGTVDGNTSAVVTNAVKFPFDFSVPASRLLSRRELDALGLGGASNARFVFGGTASTYQTSWVDPVAGELLRSTIVGDVNVNVRVTGLPVGADASSGFAGTMTIQVARIPPPTYGKSADGSAKETLRSALAAASFYHTAAGTYRGMTTDKASILEPYLRWSGHGEAKTGVVTIRARTDTSVLLVTRSRTGTAFCIAETPAGTTYGRTAPASVAGCAGGW